MTSGNWPRRISSLLVVVLVAASNSALAQGETTGTRLPGRQIMVARYTSTPPVIDGVFSPEEWRGAVPVYVDGSKHPATPPGVVPNIGPTVFVST
jgi:hypothetical protein